MLHSPRSSWYPPDWPELHHEAWLHFDFVEWRSEQSHHHETWSSVFGNANVSNLSETLFEGNKDHFLNRARTDLSRREIYVESLNKCADDLQKRTEAQDRALQDVQNEFVESRREQTALQEELLRKEESSSRYADSKYARNGKNEESARTASWTILGAKIKGKPRDHSTAHIPIAGNARTDEIYERLLRFSGCRIKLQWKIISRFQSTCKNSEFSIVAQPRWKVAAWYMELIRSTGERFCKSIFYVWFTSRSSSKNFIWTRAQKSRSCAWRYESEDKFDKWRWTKIKAQFQCRGPGEWGPQGMPRTGGGGPVRVPNLRVCKQTLFLQRVAHAGREGRINVVPWYPPVGVVSTSGESHKGWKTGLPARVSGRHVVRGRPSSPVPAQGTRYWRQKGVRQDNRQGWWKRSTFRCNWAAAHPGRLDLGWGPGQPGFGVAVDWVTGRSYSSATKAKRQLNVQSVQSEGRWELRLPIRALPSVNVGHRKGVAGSGWARWKDSTKSLLRVERWSPLGAPRNRAEAGEEPKRPQAVCYKADDNEF